MPSASNAEQLLPSVTPEAHQQSGDNERQTNLIWQNRKKENAPERSQVSAAGRTLPAPPSGHRLQSTLQNFWKLIIYLARFGIFAPLPSQTLKHTFSDKSY